MSYFLNAILSKKRIELKPDLTVVKFVELEQGLVMIPVTDSLFDEIAVSQRQQEQLVQGFEKLSVTLAESLQEISADTSVAFVEAEFWGGVGSQSAVMWKERKVVFEALNSQDAINQVLRRLGIEAKGEIDEFAAVGLGRHRFTNEW